MSVADRQIAAAAVANVVFVAFCCAGHRDRPGRRWPRSCGRW